MRIKTNPLTGRIQPPIMLAPEGGGGGGGGTTATPPPPAMGGAFSQLSKTLKQGDAPTGGETPPGEEPPPAPAPKPAAAPAPAPAAKPKPAEPAAKTPPAKSAASAMPAEVFKETPPVEPKEKPPGEAAPAELDTAELTKGMSDAARKNFARLEESYKGRLSKVQAELDEAKKNPVTPAEIEEAKRLKTEFEALKTEHAEVLKTVELIGLERSPQFQQKYVKGREKLVAEAAKKVLNAGGSDEKFRAALQLDGRAKYDAIEEALNEAPGFIANQIAAVVTQIEQLDEEKAQALQDAGGKLSEWSEEETARQREANEKLAKARESRFAELIPALAKECIFLRRIADDADGAAEWNAVVEEVAAQGKEFLFTASNFDDFAGAAVKAKAYDRLQPIFLKVREENLALSKQVAELTGSEPGSSNSGGAGGGGSGGGRGAEEKPLTFAQRVKMGMDAGSSGT